jgi:hypothetical protein
LKIGLQDKILPHADTMRRMVSSRRYPFSSADSRARTSMSSVSRGSSDVRVRQQRSSSATDSPASFPSSESQSCLPVDGRSSDDAVAHAAERIPALIVSEQEQNVGRFEDCGEAGGADAAVPASNRRLVQFP